MFWFRRKKHDKEIAIKEVLIEQSNKKLNNRVNQDINRLDRLNKILKSDATLKIYRATGHDKF